MAQNNRPSVCVRFDHLGQVCGHGGISDIIIPGAVAMVAHVDQDDFPVRRKTPAHCVEVARRTEQAVRDHQCRLGFSTIGGMQDMGKL